MSTSQEYIDFMLGNKKTPKRHSATSPSHLTNLSTPEREDPFSAQVTPRGQTSLRSIQKAFALAVIEWIALDDQIYSIVLSISNLRDRIWHSSLMLHHMSTTALSPVKASSWKQFGYREGAFSNEILTTKDLNLALDHSLQHQERMIRELRHFLSSMNTVQEKMSRRFDEYYRTIHSFDIHTDPSIVKGGGSLSINDCQELLIALAKELYRKQMIVMQIIETSTIDSLLYASESQWSSDLTTAAMANDDRNPRQVAQKCSTLWPRESTESHVLVHLPHIKELVLRYKK